jgi:hypothetical protein
MCTPVCERNLLAVMYPVGTGLCFWFIFLQTCTGKLTLQYTALYYSMDSSTRKNTTCNGTTGSTETNKFTNR